MITRNIALGILLLFISFPCFAAEGGKTLPKIRIAADGRSFETEDGRPYRPIGINYYRPHTGWAPQVWKSFNPAEFREDCVLMKDSGANCIRVFLTYGSFMSEKGRVDSEGLRKFDEFLDIAEEHGIYVHPTGPDHWEGQGCFGDAMWDRYTSEEVIDETCAFWRTFAKRYKERGAIFAYDLLNEPSIPWNRPDLKRHWNAWLSQKYASADKLAESWGVPVESVAWNDCELPADEPGKSSQQLLLDFQHCRESLARRWTRLQSQAIKEVAPDALVSVGLIQWSVPCVLPGYYQHYSGFRPSEIAEDLDFLEVHFYPLATGFYEYADKASGTKNLAYVECLVREIAKTGKPAMIGEFGWYGGGPLKNSNQERPAASEGEQADYCASVIKTTEGIAVGWLNWGYYDVPEAMDISELTGLCAADGREKEWNKRFRQIASELSTQKTPLRKIGARPDMDWDKLLLDPGARQVFMDEYCDAFEKDRRGE